MAKARMQRLQMKSGIQLSETLLHLEGDSLPFELKPAQICLPKAEDN
jgi:hypothetical protein